MLCPHYCFSTGPFSWIITQWPRVCCEVKRSFTLMASTCMPRQSRDIWMRFGQDKYSHMISMRGKMMTTAGTKLPELTIANGQHELWNYEIWRGSAEVNHNQDTKWKTDLEEPYEWIINKNNYVINIKISYPCSNLCSEISLSSIHGVFYHEDILITYFTDI